MGDAGSPYLGFLVILLLLAEAVLFGFRAALRYLGERTEETGEETGTRMKAIRYLQENIQEVGNEIFFISALINAVAGIFFGVRIYPFLQTVSDTNFLPDPVLHIVLGVAALLILAGLIYLFAVCLPGIFGANQPLKWAKRLYPPANLILKVMQPMFKVFSALAALFARFCGIDPDHIQEDVSEAEIISMVNEGHEQGVLEASEAEMIHNIFEFGDKEAQDIMTHRKHIVAVEGHMTLSDAMEYMLGTTNSRFPVYEDTIDNITGILHLKDAGRFLFLEHYGDWQVKDIPKLVRPAVFIPETRNIDDLFRGMQTGKLQMVIVADEYGQTAGVVAMEDILEEIVGNIQDEYDEEEPMIEKLSDTCYIMKGMASIEEVEETLGQPLPLDADVETLNGFLITKLDKIPKPDEQSKVQISGYEFQILSVVEKTIDRVRVTKVADVSAEEEKTEKIKE